MSLGLKRGGGGFAIPIEGWWVVQYATTHCTVNTVLMCLLEPEMVSTGAALRLHDAVNAVLLTLPGCVVQQLKMVDLQGPEGEMPGSLDYRAVISL